MVYTNIVSRVEPRNRMSLLTVIATLRARPGKEAELKDYLTTLVGYTRTEMGCVNFDLNEQQGDPGVFLAVEYWTGRSALGQHLSMPYMHEFEAAVPALLAAPPSRQVFDMLTTPKR